MHRSTFPYRVLILVGLLVVASWACGISAPRGGSGVPTPVVQATGSLIETPLGASSPVPNLPALKPGMHKESISSGGVDRPYLVYVPTGYDGSQPFPLVFVLHGFGGSAISMVKLTGFNDEAERANFIPVYLNGTGSPPGWNTGFTPWHERDVDDVQLVRDLIGKLDSQLNVDPARIYAAGFSNGAMMAHRLGAELADQLAGIAVVEGTIGSTPSDGSLQTVPDPAQPIAVMIFHGKADKTVPYDGGTDQNMLPVKDAVDFWTKADACSGDPQTETTNNGNIIKEDHATCAQGTEVLFYTIVNGMHEWPSLQNRAGISATDLIWEFFSKHAKTP